VCMCLYVGAGISWQVRQASFRLDNADPEGLTASHWAALKYHTELLRMLLEHGASPDVVDQHGHTCAHCSVLDSPLRGEGAQANADARRAVPVLELLIRHGADLEKTDTTGSTTTAA
jgi:hypothetical protein